MTTTANKADKIIYWVTTGLIALFIIPGIFFLNSEMALSGTRNLGLPMWFHWELGIAKFLGAVVLIVPFFPKRIKEWAYAGLGIDFISAAIANYAVYGIAGMWWFAVIWFAVLVISYIKFHKIYGEAGSSK
ncbi:DoxX family protein [Hufsiella ginkgonis]|uniref:DoxX family protein n=1 Tax=Hufsiella ginkgonis TaxID=2695274 RepID=A0A7K1XSY4_9SPHI|nr:DoxX family protein [Hufsiella ginkgonis]MXV14111.1 DoxX family protein [Hufsiella ginkgonis]